MEPDTDEKKKQPKIPVTILTGVLGAGKTTMLKYILKNPHGYRVAVIQNEFSNEMGIEAPLFTDEKGDTIKDVYELPNGCLCCSAKDNLIGMLDTLVEQVKKFDYVLVEATGIADPELLCEIFWVDDGLGSSVYLDSVVTLVDSRNVLSALDGAAVEGGGDAGDLGLEIEAAKQVACADVLVLNKVDLATEEKRSLISDRLRNLNPDAVLLESTYAEVPLSDILGIRAFDRGRLVGSLAALATSLEDCLDDANHPPPAPLAAIPQRKRKPNGAVIFAPSQRAVKSRHGIESIMLRGDARTVYDHDKIESWMADVLWENAAGGVYRCKGLFRGTPTVDSDQEDLPETGATADLSAAYTLQGVGRLFEIDVAPNVQVTESRFLFVGVRLSQDILESGLNRCVAS